MDAFKEKELVWMAEFKAKAESLDYVLETTEYIVELERMPLKKLEDSIDRNRHYDSDETLIARLQRTQTELIKAQKSLESAKYNLVFRQFMIDLIEKKKEEA